MGKPRLPNQKKAYKELSKRLAGYMMRVRNIYDRLNEKAAMLVESVGYEGLTEFSFDDYPEIEREVKRLLSQFVGELQTVIYSGTSSEWKSSNTFQDAVADKALKYYRAQIHGDRFKHYYRDNGDQLKAFLHRKENGLNLSSKLWNQSGNYKDALEATISTAIEKGMSATALSKKLSRYLNDWPSLQADYQEKYGKATNIHDCEYRSLRLARNEISMAYRSAEQARWQQFDFILGYKIKLSDSHPRYDICDDLTGDYPKDFKFRGWHPNCLCYTVPIVMSEDEYWSGNRDNSPNKIDVPPKNFEKWVTENSERIESARKRGALPFWVMDNEKHITRLLKKEFVYNEETRNDLVQRGFSGRNIISVEAFNKSAMNGFDIQSFDKVVENVCDKNKILIKIKQLRDAHDGKASLMYSGRDENGEVFELSRFFRFEKISGKEISVVDHKLFVLPEDLQGKGISKTLMSEMVSQYKSCGINRVYIHANIDVGGYCWARYGAIAEKKDMNIIIDNALNSSKISIKEAAEAKSIIDKYDEFVPMQNLANLSFGKKMLIGTSWQGYLDLSNIEQFEYLRNYLHID